MTSHKISFVNKIGTILKATSDDENPTAGYLYKQINDISFESGYSESLVEFLVDRLKSKSCHVKFKVLKLMKHLTENGSREFQFGLRKHAIIIKEHNKYGGPPHPMYGNVPYLMVRKIAKELCEILYNMEQISIGSTANVISLDKQESKYGGLGPAQVGGSAQGFGNTPPQPKTLGETILDGIERIGAKMSEKPSDRQAALLARLDLSSSTSNYRPPVFVSGSEEPLFTSLEPPGRHNKVLTPSIQKPVKRHQPGRAGGGWGDDDEDEDEKEDNENNNGNGSKQFSCETDSLIDQQTNRLQGEELQADWLEEAELVVSVLKQGSSGQEHVFLSPSTISSFLTKCCTLSCDKIVETLAQKLHSQDAGVVLRTLQLLEGIIYNRDELVTIDYLTKMSKEALVSCYLNGQSQSQNSTQREGLSQRCLQVNELQETKSNFEPKKMWRWKAVEVKAAKIILILQELSSYKEILSVTNFQHFVSDISPTTTLIKIS